MRYLKFFCIVFLVTAAMSLTILSEVPQLISYQGRLLDSEDNPVNETKLIKFVIYDSPGGVTELWNSGFQTVVVSNGLFDVQLGALPMPALPDDIFSTDTVRYLGVTVGVDVEIVPRIRLTAASYSYQALRADTAGYSQLAYSAESLGPYSPTEFAFSVHYHDDLYAELNHDHLGIYADISHDHAGIYSDISHLHTGIYADVTHIHDASHIESGTLHYDRYSAYDDLMSEYKIGTSPSQVAAGDHDHDAGDIVSGILSYNNFSAYNDLDYDGYLNNDAPSDVLTRSQSDGRYFQVTDDITSDNIADEPGIAHTFHFSAVTMTNAIQNYDSVSITIPDVGYVVVQATGFCYFHKQASVNNFIRLSITKVSETLNYDNFHFNELPAAFTEGYYYDNFSILKASIEPAGTHKYYLTGSTTSGDAEVQRIHLLATYYPTNYGTVDDTKSPYLSSDENPIMSVNGSDLPEPEKRVIEPGGIQSEN